VKLELEDKVTDETQQDEKSEEDQNVHPKNLQKNTGLLVRTVPAHKIPCFFRALHYLTFNRHPWISVFDPLTLQWETARNPNVKQKLYGQNAILQ
jgi:hypothetical protein